jgi:hypothetical protein
VHGATWVETVQRMLHPDVSYRHLTLTVPEALRPLFYQHAVVVLDDFMRVAQRAMDAVVSRIKRGAVKMGYIVVLQMAGDRTAMGDGRFWALQHQEQVSFVDREHPMNGLPIDSDMSCAMITALWLYMRLRPL